MADSIEQKIMAQIVTRLQTINGTGSYQTSIGTRVEDSRANWSQPDGELPAISVFQGTVSSEEADDEGQKINRTMPVLIKVFFERADTAATDAAYARKVISDIFVAIRSDDRWVVSSTPLALFTGEKSHRIEYAEQGYEVTGVEVEIEIIYRGSKFNLES